MPSSVFPGELLIKDKNKALLEAKTGRDNLKLWYDGSQLDNRGTGVAVVWEKDGPRKNWQDQKVILGLNKEIFDAEMWGISKAFKDVEQKTRQVRQPWIINIFCDSRTIINNLRRCDIRVGQALKMQIYLKKKKANAART